jgi:hypothetical protein
MVVVAIKTGQTTGEKALWGILCFILCTLGGIIFFAVKRQGLVPLLLQIGGWILAFVGGASFSYNLGTPAPTGP